MANVRISELPTVASITNATIFPVVDGGITRQINANTIHTYIESQPLTISGNLNVRNSKLVFSASPDGYVKMYSPNVILTTGTAFEITGTPDGNVQPRNFIGTLVQLTGQPNVSARFSIDAFGNATVYPSISGRHARNNVNAPTATQAGDTMFRISTQGYGDTKYNSSIARISIEAKQNFSDSNAGTRISFWNTPNNSVTIGTPIYIDSYGLNLPTNTGITYYPRTINGTNSGNVRFDVDQTIFANFNNTTYNITIDSANLIAGRSVDYYIKNQNSSQNWTVTHGLPATNSTSGSTSVTMVKQNNVQTSHLKYFCMDGTLANTFVSIIYQ